MKVLLVRSLHCALLVVVGLVALAFLLGLWGGPKVATHEAPGPSLSALGPTQCPDLPTLEATNGAGRKIMLPAP